MKVFFKKLKKSNPFLLILYLASLVAYLVGYIQFATNLFHLSGIETILRAIALVLFLFWFLFWFIYGLVTLFTHKSGKFVIALIFTVLFSFIFYFASYYINSLYTEIDSMSKETATYTSVLISLNDTEFTSDSTIGIISDTTNVEGYVLAKKLIEKEGLTNSIRQYDDFYLMLEDLYNHTIDACFVSSNYAILFGSEETYSNMANEVKVLFSYSEEMENQDNISYTSKDLTEPFTVLVLGVDSETDGLNANAAFNGDTMMLITFNPKTLTVSMFSLPRDLYVPITCRNNNLAKINSSAAYGVSCVANTIKNLTNIDIDYYVKINFKGVVDLVDALGGIEVDVEAPYFNVNNGVDYHGQVCEQNSSREFYDKVVCMDPGLQILNGEQALAYSRDRHQYIGSDLDRIRHQQDVVSAIANSAKKISSFDEFKNVLNAVQRNMDTNMTTEQILSLYSVGKSVLLNTVSGEDFTISMNRTKLETYSLPVYIGSTTTSALGYYTSSLDDIVHMMKVNLELEEDSANTTFSIDYNEDYTTHYYGQGLYTGKSVQTMISLIGSSKEYAMNWLTSQGATYSIIECYPGDENYNESYGDGIVTNQSLHINSVLYSGANITLYVNHGTSTAETTSEETTTNEE